jgi:hypothetical protein
LIHVSIILIHLQQGTNQRGTSNKPQIRL